MTILVFKEPRNQMQNTDRWQVGNATVTRVIESEAGAFPPGFMKWSSDDISILGRDPRSFEQFAHDHANAFTPAAPTGA